MPFRVIHVHVHGDVNGRGDQLHDGGLKNRMLLLPVKDNCIPTIRTSMLFSSKTTVERSVALRVLGELAVRYEYVSIYKHYVSSYYGLV